MSLKKYQREQQKKLNKYVGVVSLIVAGALSMFLVGIVYLYMRVWNPLKSFSAKLEDSQMNVEISLKVPAEVVVLYGTSPETLSQIDLGKIDKHSMQIIRGVLPDKKHFVRIKTKTANGNVYITEPLEVQ